MHWFEGKLLLFCRFVFPKYHKCINLSRETRLHRYCTCFTALAKNIPIRNPARAVSHLSRYLPINRVVTTNLLYVTEIFYRTLLFIFWASAVQSYLVYFAPRSQTYEEIPLGLGLLAGIHFARILERLSCLETRAVPCLYLPISIYLSDIQLFLEVIFGANQSAEHERIAVCLFQMYALGSFWIIQEYLGPNSFMRVFTIFIALSFYVVASVLCPDPVRSIEWQRTMGVLP